MAQKLGINKSKIPSGLMDLARKMEQNVTSTPVEAPVETPAPVIAPEPVAAELEPAKETIVETPKLVEKVVETAPKTATEEKISEESAPARTTPLVTPAAVTPESVAALETFFATPDTDPKFCILKVSEDAKESIELIQQLFKIPQQDVTTKIIAYFVEQNAPILTKIKNKQPKKQKKF